MTRILYVLAAILIVIWAIGFFFYSLGAIIHLLLLLALIAILLRFAYRSNRRSQIRRDQFRNNKTGNKRYM